MTVEDVRAAADSGAPALERQDAAGKGEVTARELTPTETTIAPHFFPNRREAAAAIGPAKPAARKIGKTRTEISVDVSLQK